MNQPDTAGRDLAESQPATPPLTPPASGRRGRTIADLREALFQTIEGVRTGQMDLDRARVVSDLSQVLVNTAKVEVDYLRASKGESTGFLEQPDDAEETPRIPLPNGVVGITRHLLKG